MQIAQAGGLLCLAHVDTIQQNVRAGATQGLALTYSLPAKDRRDYESISGRANKRRRIDMVTVFAGMRQVVYEHLLEDAPVHDEHHNAWNPKANRAGDERIGLVDHKRALIRTQRDLTQMFLRCVPAQKDGRKRDEGGQYPDIGEHKTDGAVCHIQWILQGTHYSIVSVKGGCEAESLE